MEVTLESYRDSANQIVDDMEVENAAIERLVVLRNGDETITVRGEKDGDTFEEQFEISNRQYVGLIPQQDDSVREIHSEIQDLLAVVGFIVEPQNIEMVEGGGECLI